MSNNNFVKPLSIAISTTVVSLAAAGSVSAADVNPFGMAELSSGYMQLAEGKCGEDKMAKDGKCGEDMKAAKMAKDGKCGEGKCGEDKKMKEKMKEGKCGEKK